MSGAIDDGGPAFPTGTQVAQNHATGETVVNQYLSDGISVRDYFAAKSLPLMVAIYDADSDNPFPILAKAVYAMADEMLKARKS